VFGTANAFALHRAVSPPTPKALEQVDDRREKYRMAEQINALLVHSEGETFRDLTRALNSLSIKMVHARNCREASEFLKKKGATDMVFAGTNLLDGGWADILALTQQSKSYLPVIVVSRMVDLKLYLDALGRGAFDFITPPFLTSDLARILRSAIYKELVSVKQGLTAPLVA
jgi:DNA-binding NtrC family response regulator